MTFIANVLHLKIYGICMHTGFKTAHKNKSVMSCMLHNFVFSNYKHLIYDIYFSLLD
jgi:hypothetical protein